MILNMQVLSGCKLLDSFKALPEFPVRMDIRVIEETANLYSLRL
jgi:hypothetical protein